MPTEVIMPALGIAQDTGTVIRWLKQEGEAVTQGEPLMEIETDKATVEVESPGTGTLSNVTAGVGEPVPVGQVIAVIVASGEAVPAQPPSPRSGSVPVTPVATRPAAEHGVDLSEVKAEGSRLTKADIQVHVEGGALPDSPPAEAQMRASPRARRLAAEQGIDLAQIRGSGANGAVLSTDLTMPARRAAATEPRTVGPGAVWRIMAERTTQSWTAAPHFFLSRQVNAHRLVTWREQAQRTISDRLSYTDLLIKVVAHALHSHPNLNAQWHEGTVLLHEEVNVGFAVAIEDGLVVPTIHQADRMTLSDIHRCRTGLVTRAREKKLRPEDISGGTFTISNLGMFGVDAFYAVINPPQAAILTVGRITPQVVPVNGLPDVQPMMTLGLSCDHRVVDGIRGARFLETMAELTEEPIMLLAS